jgi:hypothetical protein
VPTIRDIFYCKNDMTEPMHENNSSNTKKYLSERKHFRELAKANFFKSYNDDMGNLIQSINELTITIFLFASGKMDWGTIKDGMYVADLSVSFCRSHFIIIDLIISGELIEAGTLIRKQMELISRLHQIAKSDDVSKIIGKTPNIKNLINQSSRKLYSQYSQVVHSSTQNHLQMLGTYEQNGILYTPLYPVFCDDSFLTTQHWAMCSFEYFCFMQNFYIENFEDYESQKYMILFDIAAKKFTDIEWEKPSDNA